LNNVIPIATSSNLTVPIDVRFFLFSQQISMPQIAVQHHPPHGIGGTNMGRYHSYDNFSASQHSPGPTPIGGLNASSHNHSNNNGLSTSQHRHNNNNDLNGSSLHSFSSVGPTPISLNTSLHRHNNNNELNASSVHSQQHNGMNTSVPQHLSGQHNGNGMMLPSSHVGMSGPPQFHNATHVGMQSLQQQQQQLMNQQQMNQQQMNQQQMNQQQMNQHQQQSLDQHAQHPGAPRQVMPPSGMNVQGGNTLLPSGYREIDIIQNKLLSLSQSQSQHSTLSPSESQHSTYHDQFEPRPIDPSLVALKSPPEQKEEYVENESEGIVPLPSRREPRKTPNKRNYKREGSDSSLQVDTIFPASHVQSNSSNQHLNNNNLSVMSLSISEMNHVSTDHYNPHRAEHHRTEPPHHGVQPEGLTAMFNSSMRFSGDRRKPVRRSGSNDEESSEKGLNLDMSVATLGDLSGDRRKPVRRLGSNDEESTVKEFNLDMSVATLGDHMSEMGEMSYAVMGGDSQANMSFSNVFEETERDLYVNGG
jgi:hypothetical protein